MTDREIHTLKMLAQGKSYFTVGQFFGIRSETVHAICQQIRKKTGIKSTKDVEEMKSFVFGTGKEIVFGALRYKKEKDMPTQAQIQILKLRAKQMGRMDIAKELGLSVNTVVNAISLGCKRARIRPDPDCITNYLQEKGFIPRPDPMDDPFFSCPPNYFSK